MTINSEKTKLSMIKKLSAKKKSIGIGTNELGRMLSLDSAGSSRLMNQKVEKFSIIKLMDYCAILGMKVDITIDGESVVDRKALKQLEKKK